MHADAMGIIEHNDDRQVFFEEERNEFVPVRKLATSDDSKLAVHKIF
jgi:hypothetical protein